MINLDSGMVNIQRYLFSMIQQASLVEPWFIFLHDAVKPKWGIMAQQNLPDMQRKITGKVYLGISYDTYYRTIVLIKMAN